MIGERLACDLLAVQVGSYQDPNNAMRAQNPCLASIRTSGLAWHRRNPDPYIGSALGLNNRDEAERVVHRVKNRGYTALIVAMAR